jgi:DNA-binding transcriptional LysR family regulator
MAAELNLHHLRLFYRVATLGSISRAAAELNISQPSVSAQIRELELRCGVDLLHRLPRGVALTDAGRLIFDHAERMFTVADELAITVDDLRSFRGGQLTVGGSLTAGEYFLPTVVKHFKERYPAVEPVLVLDNSTVILARIAQRELALGFIGTDAVGSELMAVPCWRDELVVIAPPGSFPPGSDAPTFASLRSRAFVLREPGSATRQWTERYLRTEGLTVRASMTVGSPEAVNRHVAAGLGWGFASKHGVAREVTAGLLEIAPIAGWGCRRTFYAAHRRDHRLSRSQQNFLEIAQSFGVELAGGGSGPVDENKGGV